MDTRWKTRKLRTGAKALCFLLSLALLAGAATVAMDLGLWLHELTQDESGVYVSYSSIGAPFEQYFAYEAMTAFSDIATVTGYRDRESILSGEFLYWDAADEPYGSAYDEALSNASAPVLRYRLVSILDQTEYAAVDFTPDMSHEALESERQRVLSDAARLQIADNLSFYDGLSEEKRQEMLQGAYFRWISEWWTPNAYADDALPDAGDTAPPSADENGAGDAYTANRQVRHVYTLYGLSREGDTNTSTSYISDTRLLEDDPALRRMEEYLIAQQLSQYDDSVRRLEQQTWLRWYAAGTADDGTATEYGDPDVKDLQAPNYAVWANGSVAGSRVRAMAVRWPWINSQYAKLTDIRVVFDSAYVETVYTARREAQDHLFGAGFQIVLLLLLSLAAFCAAAALKARDPLQPAPRRMWLDVLLVLAALPTVFAVVWIGRGYPYYSGDVYAVFSSMKQSVLFYLATILLTVLLVFLPALWLLALIRRIQEGGWWRHTLVYALLAWIGRGVRRLFGALPLVLQALLVLAILAAEAFFVCAFWLNGADAVALLLFIVFLIADLAFLGMLILQLRAVERGAAAAARGEEVKLPPMFGVFGRIGRSVSDLSGSIALAVEERMTSERMKTELITNVSHDIRTPLTGLIAYVDLLLTEGLDSENAPGYVDILAQKAQRLKTLTDDLFEASKAASGNLRAELETLDLCELARQVLGEMDERIAQSGLDFRVTLPERAPVRGDGRLLWRVVDNLLDNALKYSMPGSRVYMSLEECGAETRLWLKNMSALPLNGQVSELSERFKRGDESRATEGSGLGLSIVQSFMDSQHGRLELDADGDLFKVCVVLPREV